MHIKIEINHLENICPPPRNLSKSPEQTQHQANNPNPSRKNPKHFRKHLHHSKKLKPLPKNLNLPEKLPLPKNSITITETMSNTRTKSQPLPEKSQPLVKNSQSLLKKSQPHIPLKHFFNPP